MWEDRADWVSSEDAHMHSVHENWFIVRKAWWESARLTEQTTSILWGASCGVRSSMEVCSKSSIVVVTVFSAPDSGHGEDSLWRACF